MNTDLLACKREKVYTWRVRVCNEGHVARNVAGSNARHLRTRIARAQGVRTEFLQRVRRIVVVAETCDISPCWKSYVPRFQPWRVGTWWSNPSTSPRSSVKQAAPHPDAMHLPRLRLAILYPSMVASHLANSLCNALLLLQKLGKHSKWEHTRIPPEK